ncbi:hypothetical protein GCM10010236_07820 [Streptomyces eurythermus]|nr:hypothetical protein GCM10010236_07820 [Streptomyces eurythermus]
MAPPSRVNPAITPAAQRRTLVMRELSPAAFPEPDVDAPASMEQTREQRRHQVQELAGAVA